MTIEHAPSTNGRGASGEAYDAPRRVYARRPATTRRTLRPRLLRLLAPMLMAVALALVLRGIAEAPEKDA
ncbi:MAG: hypothetical protein KGK07_00940 [Chloroflexota bacterium]|nr:hypothetical protein [Chloroflexota bacterium]